MRWLPHEFNGVRACAEAEQDLLAIAQADGGLNEAHVTVDPDDGDEAGGTGPLSARAVDDGRTELSLHGEPLFEFDPQRCRGAWLSTLDGADYYRLCIDLGWGRVELLDAYNE